jgi:hypothetical protein
MVVREEIELLSALSDDSIIAADFGRVTDVKYSNEEIDCCKGRGVLVGSWNMPDLEYGRWFSLSGASVDASGSAYGSL